MTRPGRIAAAALIVLAIGAVPVRAEIVYLASGRTMSVKSHRDAGESVVLVLRSGGEITCARDLVARVVPDEVPYPEPAAPAPVPAGAGDGAYWSEIERAATENGVDPRLVLAVIEVESASQPRAVSAKGAMGLMQLMPETAREYGVANPFDPKANIEAGTKHLKSLLERYDLSLALAAYNAGAGAVDRYGGVPPFPETRDYVSRVMARLGRN